MTDSNIVEYENHLQEDASLERTHKPILTSKEALATMVEKQVSYPLASGTVSGTTSASRTATCISSTIAGESITMATAMMTFNIVVAR